METPSSIRRVTRSQTLATSANSSNLILSKRVDDPEKIMTKSRQKSAKKQPNDRPALIDITNDSPIVGLAMGNLKTPSSHMSKKRTNNGGKFSRTPGSGEALLRGQVKTLLQKVEEEAELSKIAIENGPLFNIQGLMNSPMNLVAPTPANTPQVLNLSANDDDFSHVTSSLVPEKFPISPMIMEMVDEKKQESIESESLITRSLLIDFTEKSNSSVLTSQGTVLYRSNKNRSEKKGDDGASIWSIQVKASSTRDDDDDDEEDETESYFKDEDYHYEEDGYGDNDGVLDYLCEGISKLSVGPKFEGKHIRFLYNSDDEIQEEEQVSVGSCLSPGALRLKGLPTPKGKHLRFSIE